MLPSNSVYCLFIVVRDPASKPPRIPQKDVSVASFSELRSSKYEHTSLPKNINCGVNVFCAEPTSEDSEVEDLFENVEMASDWEGAGLEVGGLGDSAVSPFGRTPSANHTLLCSRDRDPKGGETRTELHFTLMFWFDTQTGTGK